MAALNYKQCILKKVLQFRIFQIQKLDSSSGYPMPIKHNS